MKFRDYFVGVEQFVQMKNGGYITQVNFDNGTTTPPVVDAVKAIDNNLDYYASAQSGGGQKAEYCSRKIEEARRDILGFFHVKKDSGYSVIFVKSATEGINLLAFMLADKNTVMLATRMEHHANDLPWRRYAGKMEYVEVKEDGRLDLRDLEHKLAQGKGTIGYVTVTAASNVTGYVNDIHKIAEICHCYGVKIVVDAAFMTAHREIDIPGNKKEEQIDFLVFSGHKAYAPFGAGALIGRTELLNEKLPLLEGGLAEGQVFDEGFLYEKCLERMEAGAQNYFGIVTMAEALKAIQKITLKEIRKQEEKLRDYLIKELALLPDILLYGDSLSLEDRLAVIPFNVKGMNPAEVSSRLSEEIGVVVRSGRFCAQPYVMRLLKKENRQNNRDIQENTGMLRISLSVYNTREEADLFLNYMEKLQR